jgi:hypothetical protein
MRLSACFNMDADKSLQICRHKPYADTETDGVASGYSGGKENVSLTFVTTDETDSGFDAFTTITVSCVLLQPV